ncbi:intermembrane lipid transfer protein VPS13D-like [Patella vulgata]|uniref:intermembrane lipid transfer protein VPS13D-like n=1 Tax=Patella vulgata TaxID=6465 RepID=UPI0024A99EFC|nr:intermembrane lipid transfer protein VPS13D-like [Patella vulgata]
MVINKLDTPVELKLENTDESGQYECLNILPNVPTALPLSRVYDRLWARPLELSLNFCDQPIQWEHVLCKGEVSNGIKQCDPIQGAGIYRFCVCVQRENYPTKEEVAAELDLDIDTFATLPGHAIYILPPLIIKSLIPIELMYYVKNTDISGSLKAGKEANIHAADVTKDFEIGINLENFEKCQELTIPPKTYNYFVRLRIYDKKNRRLDLGVRIITGKSGNVKLSISAPYWLLNKSGLPLIFKQEGSKTDAAGQFEEHEIARSVTPLLFSYYEKDEPNLVCIRLGKRHHGAEALPQWCNKISLENGSGTRQLHVVQRHTNRPDWVYNIGYQITKGIGKFADTKIITIAPRYEIDNQSHHKLAIAQKYLINNGNSENTFLTTLPKSKLPYHWPRMDLDQLLCIRIMDIPTCQWSGGFCVDKSKSFHVNMRDSEGRCLLLKVEIILQGPTFFIVLADAETMPPPFRLDNLSPIPVKFYQTEITDDRLQTLLRPNTSVLYAWDEPILEPSLSLQIPGGMTATYNLNKLGEGTQLNYENYIYLAATHTFNRPVSSDRELVLDSTTENHIIFKRKEKDKRSQMWRMTSDGMLEHYGSMPPSEPAKSRPRGLVLDILDIAPQPTEIVPLILRKADERRKSTQTWKFTDDGRLMSQAGPMCVQVLGGVNLLKDGAIAVLGPSPNFVPKLPDSPSYPCPVPAHMLVSRQKLRPGSGCLSVQVIMDGPIRVLQIADRRHTEVVVKSVSCDMNDWEVYDMADRPSNPNDEETKYTASHLEVTMSLKGGLGISLINDVPEELVYIKLNNIFLEVLKTPALTTLEINVAGVQVDNQMFGAQRPVVLFVTQTQQREGPDNTPALYISAHKLPSGKWNAEIYKHLIITTKRLTIQVEERLLWKLMPFFGYKSDTNHDMAKVDDDTQQVISAGSTVQAKRYYFGMLKLKTGRVTLSMVTASKLSPDLLAVKNSLSMHLIAFEEAKVDLDQFLMNHPFETSSFLLNEIMTHYTEELKSQAAKILGSVDFLGNPLGFVNDVTEGLSGLIKDGNVGGLFKNVTHGVSNTAAKMTGALSDGLTTISMDDKHNKTREDLRQVESGQGSSHVLAGIKGLGYGIYGGLTGIVTQSYSGAKEKGIGGFFKGAGKGLVGTVTKPVAGVLDFTSGMANAVRDTSRVSSRVHPPRVRDPRVNPGAQGLISSYSGALARAQWLLYSLNNNDYSEYIISLEYLGYGENNLMAMVSSHSFRILKQKSKVSEEMLFVKLKDIVKAEFKVVFDDSGQSTGNETQTRRLSEKIYLTLTMKADVSRSRDTSVKRPQIRCERINIAKKVCQQINYARNLFDDETHTLIQTELKDNSC